MPINISKGKYVETPPAFCNHLPMFNPDNVQDHCHRKQCH